MTEQKRRPKPVFKNFDEVITDIEQLASGKIVTSGNYTFAQIVKHLATTNQMVIGEIVPPKLPLMMRMLMPLMRKKILNGPVEPGFKLPNTAMQTFFWDTSDVQLSDAIDKFKRSVEAYRKNGPLPVHPIFGKATAEEIEGITLRHAAMHLSFVSAEPEVRN